MSNPKISLDLRSSDATEKLGAIIAKLAKPGSTILLKGDLGAGKTTLTRGFLRERGHLGAVKSPTFTLVESYDIEGQTIHHFDLYRIADPAELDFIGFDEYFDQHTVVLVEWPQLGGDRLPPAAFTVELSINGDGREAAVMINHEHLTKAFAELAISLIISIG